MHLAILIVSTIGYFFNIQIIFLMHYLHFSSARCWSTIAITSSWWIRVRLLWTPLPRTSKMILSYYEYACIEVKIYSFSNVFHVLFVQHLILTMLTLRWLLVLEIISHQRDELRVAKNKTYHFERIMGCFCILLSIL